MSLYALLTLLTWGQGGREGDTPKQSTVLRHRVPKERKGKPGGKKAKREEGREGRRQEVKVLVNYRK